MKLLVVGGTSRAAIAFRAYIAGIPEIDVTVLCRRQTNSYPSEKIIITDDYFSCPPSTLEGVDVVVNFVGITKGTASELEMLNAAGPQKLARTADAAGVRQWIQISSLSVYGTAKDIDDQTPVHPLTPYGRSKLAGDEALSSVGGSLGVTLLRVPILYSATARGKLHMLARTMETLGFFPVPTSLQPRSVLHLDNLANAIMISIRSSLTGIQFAADPEPFTIEKLADVIGDKTGRRPKLIRLPNSTFALLKRLKPGIHTSLYERSLIAPQYNLLSTSENLRALDAGLAEVITQK